jgi:protoheme IX farnesyltransferase
VTHILNLIRFKISIFILFSALVGYFYNKVELNSKLLLTLSGVFFLASACSALNQIEEEDIDSAMVRTKIRPIPLKAFSKRKAALICVILFMVAFTCFTLLANLFVIITALFTVIVYNFLYTPLKQKTTYAILIGALIGATPPLIGYLAAGYVPLNYKIIVFIFTFYIWQIPHFWFLTEIYKNDYKKVRIPTLQKLLSKRKYEAILDIWIVTFIATLLFLPLLSIIEITYYKYIIYVLIAIYSIFYIYFKNNKKLLFINHNLLMGLVMLVILTERIILRNS